MTRAAATPHAPKRDRTRQITTPEGLTLTLTLATRGARVGALLLDLAMASLLTILITVALIALAASFAHQSKLPASGPALQALYIIWTAALFLLRNAWFLAFELGPRGATPGKRLLGIRIAGQGGQRLTPEMVIARNLLRDIELVVPLTLLVMANASGATPTSLAALAWLAIFSAMPLYNRDRLRCGDLIGGTWVVEAPRCRLEASLSAPTTTRPSYHFSAADLATYGEYELQALERVLRDNGREAMTAVAETICAKIHWTPPGQDEVRPFLEAYYTQLRARLEAGMQMGRRKANKFEG